MRNVNISTGRGRSITWMVFWIKYRGKQMKKFESYSRVLPWFMALLLSALVAACGGGGGASSSSGLYHRYGTRTGRSTAWYGQRFRDHGLLRDHQHRCRHDDKWGCFA